MRDNYRDWKEYREITLQSADKLEELGYSVDDAQKVTLVPTLMQIAKSLAVIADELSDINQKMEKKW